MTASPDPPDTQTELAKERNRIAADRTLLTWIRSSVSFIGMGFGISQVLIILEGRIQSKIDPVFNPRVLGLIFIGLGVFIAIAAALDYRGEIARLQQTDYFYRPRPSLGLIVGGAVIFISFIALEAVWHKRIPLL